VQDAALIGIAALKGQTQYRPFVAYLRHTL
jgi:hypothetical protein